MHCVCYYVTHKQYSHIAECCVMCGEVLLGLTPSGARIVLVEFPSPHTNLPLPRPSAARIILVWCAGVCLLTFPSAKVHKYSGPCHILGAGHHIILGTHFGTVCMYLS